MKRILVPTDFSENARNALIAALKLAREIGGEVLLLYVYDKPSSGQSVLRDLSSQLEQHALQDLDQELVEVKEYCPGVQTSLKAVKGDVPEMIHKTVGMERIDLIVMGKTGRSGFSNKLFGSVAVDTIEGSNVPVWLIPEKWTFAPLTRFCFASDLSDLNYAEILKPLCQLSRVFNAQVDVVHFSPDPEYMEELQQEGAKARKDINAVLGELKHQFILAVREDVTKALLKHLDQTECDTVVMIKHEYPWGSKVFRKSPTLETAIKTKIPLLVLH
ncbi:MAG: universal stress protein [Cryomorphaceae bacterium]|nr:MAG: universal stress protein [Cryomorphaceae bacterium]